MYLTTLKKRCLLCNFFLFSILGTACVTVRTPDGGPQDMTPPTIISSSPQHESINFKGNKIIAHCNKEIVVEDLHTQLIIMPTLQKPKTNKQAYQYDVRGKSLIIKPTCPLKEDTTYTFFFNGVIKDLKEGNKAKNSILTFSTGNSLDALSVEGSVRDLLENHPLDNVNVCLYNTEQNTEQIDSTEDIQENHTTKDNTPKKTKGGIQKEAINTKQKKNVIKSTIPNTTQDEQKDETKKQLTPDYFTQTDQNGKFKLTHIKAGTYTIRVHNGKENKFEIDYQQNFYGFLPTPLNITEDIQDIAIPMVKWDVSDFKLIGQQPNNQFFEIICSKPIANYSLVTTHTLQKSQDPSIIWSHLVDKKQVIRVYNTLGLLEEDNCEAVLKAVDAIGNTIEEPINIQFKDGEYKKEKIECTIKPDSGAYITSDFTATIYCTKPIKEIALEGIYFTYNDKEETIQLVPEDISLNTTKDELTISKQLPSELISSAKIITTQTNTQKKEQDITLHLTENSLIAADNSKNEAKNFQFFCKDAKKHGSICGTITTKASGFLIQLLDEKYQIIDFIRNDANYQFNMIAPGNYILRILILTDKEAEWSPGNIRKNIPPDPVIFYPDKIAVIENWSIRNINLEF